MIYRITWRDRANPKKHGLTAHIYLNRDQAEAKMERLAARLPDYEYEVKEDGHETANRRQVNEVRGSDVSGSGKLAI